MTENIRVAIRVRPLNPNEVVIKSKKRESLAVMPVQRIQDEFDGSNIISCVDKNLLLFDPRKKSSDKRQFRFDCLLGTTSTQEDVFTDTIKDSITKVLDGFNSTVFAYGATGAGKSHTIIGTESEPGLIYKAVESIFHQMEALKKADVEVVEMSLSFLEVYNETVRDLFHPGKLLDLREDNERVQVAGLTERYPESLDQVMKLLLKGNSNRAKASTAANATSSRSHAILQIHIKKYPKLKNSAICIKRATLSIIDLAGSERASVTLNKGERLNEGANINRSLLALGNCINALSSGKSSSHIPYRDSKLTRLLKYSLSGNCRVVMIACISPALIHAEETLNTLKYANRAKEIKTKTTQNTMDVSVHASQYPHIIQELQKEIERLKKAVPVPEPSSEHSSLKMGKYFVKIEEKEILIIEADFENRWNQIKADRLQNLLVLLNEVEASAEQRRAWNGTILQINEAIDVLMADATVFRHNIEEYRRAIDRYKERIQKILTDSPGLMQHYLMSQMNLEVALSAANRYQEHALLKKVQDIELGISSVSIKYALSSEPYCSSKVSALFDSLRETITGVQDAATPIYDESSATSEIDDSFDSMGVRENGDILLEDVDVLEQMVLPFQDVVPVEATPRKKVKILTEECDHQGDDENEATPIQRRVKMTPSRSGVKKSKTPRKRRTSLLPVPRKSSRLSLMHSDITSLNNIQE